MVQIASYGPWAVVTGASSGIGRAFAAHLAAAGLDLVLAARSTDRMAELGSALSAAHGVGHRVVGVDLSRSGATAELLAATADLDVGLLVSNAGTARTGPFLDQPVEELHRRLTLNAAAHLDLVHAFGRRFVDRGRGGVLLVSALGAQHGWENMAHDGGAKAYLHSLGEALHHELKPAGVAVTVMLPGNVDTPVLDELGIERSAMPLGALSPEAAVRQTVAAFLRGRPRLVPDRRMRAVTRFVPRPVMRRLRARVFAEGARTVAARSA
jgi:short-subunit dehydrogenase